MLRYFTVIVSALLFVVESSGQVGPHNVLSPEDKAYLDSLDNLAFRKFGTFEGLRLQDSVIIHGNRLGGHRYVVQATQDKVSTYYNLGLFDRLDLLMDSIEAHSDYKTAFPRVFYRMQQTHINSYTHRGYSRMASAHIERFVAIADSLENAATDSASTMEALSIKLMAISALVQSDVSLSFHTAITRDKLVDLVSGLEGRYGSFLHSVPNEYFNLMQDFFRYRCRGYKNGDDTTFVEQYKNAFTILEHYAKPVNINAKLPMYEFYLAMGRMHIAIGAGDQSMSWRNMHTLSLLIDKYPKLQVAKPMMFQARYDYEFSYGNYERALTYSDSLMPYYGNLVNSRGKAYWKERMRLLNHLARNEEAVHIANHLVNLYDTLQERQLETSAQELSAMLGFEMTESESKLLKSQLMVERHKTEVSYLIALSSVLLGVICVVSLAVYQNRKHSRKLEIEVDRQTSELRAKNRDITDSINYAQRIQEAMLPDLGSFVGHGLTGASVYFKPRNVVSGDFYWAYQYSNHILIACADCTGHGVPGAFMSMIGTTLLNDICNTRKIYDPANILEALDSQLISILSLRNANEVQDGMDITIMSFDLQTQRVFVSSARRPYFFVHNGVLTEYKGIKRSIDEHEVRNRANAFVSIELDVSRGDRLYMFSDGLPDQYGGQDKQNPLGRRLKSSGMKKFVEQLSKVAVNRQSDEADRLFTQWKGTCAQVDDVSMVVVQF